MASEEQWPERSTTPSKKIWYSLAPEPVELSPPRSQSSSSSRSSKSARSLLHEYASPSQVSDLEEGLLGEDSQSRLEGSRVTTEEQPLVKEPRDVAETSGTGGRLSGIGTQRKDSEENGRAKVKTLEKRTLYSDDPGFARESLVDHDRIKQSTRDLSSKSEVLSSAKSSVSHASSYFDSMQSRSTIGITGKTSRETLPLVEGTLSLESGSSLDAPMETPHGSQGDSILEMDENEVGGKSSVDRLTKETWMESEQVDVVISSQTTGSPVSKIETPGSPMGVRHRSAQDELSQYPLDYSEEGHQIPDKCKSEVPEQKSVEGEITASSRFSNVEQEGAVVGADESNGSVNQKYLERSSEIGPYASATSFHELLQEYTAAQVDFTAPAHDSEMSEDSHVSQPLGDRGTSVTSTQSYRGDEASQGSSYYQDPWSSSKSGSVSSQSVPDDQGVRGSQVQLPLDFNSLQPSVSQSQVVPSRSGVLRNTSGDLEERRDQAATTNTSSSSLMEQTLLKEQTAPSEPGAIPVSEDEFDGRVEVPSRRLADSLGEKSLTKDYAPESGSIVDQDDKAKGLSFESRTSFDSAKVMMDPQPERTEPATYTHSLPDFRSQSTSGGRRPDHLETRATRSSESHLIRPIDLYGSPKDQSIEDSLARKVAQLLIESGQIAFIPKDKTGKTRSNSSSCSGSPDSIDGSLTPSSQKDYAQGQDSFGRKESLSRQLSGRQSPASSVSSCTDSLALHVQQLLKESEHLRARAPGRDAGYSGGILQSEATNLSDVSTSSSVRRIIKRVDGAKAYEEPRQSAGEGFQSREGRESSKRHSAELRSSGHSSPLSQGRGSPYRPDSGRESPRYTISGSPSHARSARTDIPVLQQHQEAGHLVDDGERTGAPSRESLSRRVQTILGSTAEDVPSGSGGGTDMYHSIQDTGFTTRYHEQDPTGPRSLDYYQMQGSLPRSRSEQMVEDEGYRESSLGYQTQRIDPMRVIQGGDDRESVTRRVQAILMGEDAPEERVDRVLQEAEVPPPIPDHQAEDEFQALPQSLSDHRLDSSQTTATHVPSYDDRQPPVMGSFAALERARANLEQQLQMVSERTFDSSLTWETPVKHRKAESDQSFDRGPPVRPYEAWRESRIPIRGQDFRGMEDSGPMSDPQHYGPSARSSGSIRATDEEFYSLPPSGSPSRPILRTSHDASGARPRSYPQAESTRTPSYGRSQSIPSSSGIPRRSLPTTSSSSAGSRPSQGGMETSGRSMDFTSQLRTPAEYYRDDRQGSYRSPYQSSSEPRQITGVHFQKSAVVGEPNFTDHPPRPMSATLPRSADRSRRSTFGSGGYATAEGTLPQSTTRDSLGGVPDRSILHPYRPPGSAETMYTYHVDGGRDQFSSTINSSTTMESTHIGSDDAQPPHFPAHALGSRRDPPPRDGSMIPRMSPRQPARTEGTPREQASTRVSTSSGLADTPLDLSQSRIRTTVDASHPLPRSLGRSSPTHTRYSQERVEPDRQQGAAERDVHYAKLPTHMTQSQSVLQEGRRSTVPGAYSRQVLTDVLQDESGSLIQADEMWRQYQQRQLNDTEGASSDDTRVQKLASLIHDPVGHTVRNIIQEGGGVTDQDERPSRGIVDGNLVSETAAPKSRDGTTTGIQTEGLIEATPVSYKENVVATQTSFTSMEGEEQPKRVREGQSSSKRQKTGRSIPPSSIPTVDSRPTEMAVAKAVTPTKRKAVSQGEAYETTGSDVTAESVLSDLSLDSEQLLLLLGSHGVKKLSSKLVHLQQRIEKQREHHRKQTAAGGGKSRKPKHPAVKRKTLPRPARSSTPAGEPRESDLVQEVADIVVPQDQETATTSPSTVSPLTTTQGTSDLDSGGLDSVASTTSESTLVEPVKSQEERKDDLSDRSESTMTLEQGRGRGHAGPAKDDSEVEYRTSESDVSVLCSCRPELRRPKSATEANRGRGATEDRGPSEPASNDGFRRPVGVPLRVASRIPIKDKNGSAGRSMPAEDNRNHHAQRTVRTRPKSFPRGTAFTIDLSKDLEGEEEEDKDARVEKGVLDNIPEKARNGKKVLVERRGTNVANRVNETPRSPTGIAWFQPFSKRMPWQEERPRPKPIIIAALQHDPTTGKVSLQDAFLRHRPDFISQCRERQRKMRLAAEERHTQASLEIERQRIFDEQKAKKANPLAHPYSTQLHQPAKRTLTKKEMKKQTSKIYSRLPEVVQKQEENKKQAINETNRIRAQIYRKKLKDRLRAGWPHQ